MKKPSTVNTVFKAFRLIELFVEPNAEFSLTEISRKLDISIGAVQRITNSLMDIGYLAKDAKTKKYLGFQESQDLASTNRFWIN